MRNQHSSGLYTSAHTGLPSPFEIFKADLNRWLRPGGPASETEALRVWAQGCRDAAFGALCIERQRGISARRSASGVLGDLVAAAVLIPGGMIATGFASLFPCDAEAATTAIVTTREGVLAYAAFALIVGIAIGYVLCWWTCARVHVAEEENYTDHPDFSRVIEISSRRVRS